MTWPMRMKNHNPLIIKNTFTFQLQTQRYRNYNRTPPKPPLMARQSPTNLQKPLLTMGSSQKL